MCLIPPRALSNLVPSELTYHLTNFNVRYVNKFANSFRVTWPKKKIKMFHTMSAIKLKMRCVLGNHGLG